MDFTLCALAFSVETQSFLIQYVVFACFMQGPIENDVVIHVALIAESQRLKVFLNTQTPQQVEPIQIWPQKELVKYTFVLECYSENVKLQEIYRILGKPIVCYPIVFDLSDFYLSQDVMLLIDDIKNALQFIKQYWKMPGRPLFLTLIREDNINHREQNKEYHNSFEELELPKHSKVKRQTSTPNASDLEQQPEISTEEWLLKSTFEILQKFNDCDCLASQAQLASILLRKDCPDFFDRNVM
ncbi:hypothetical protein cypCar_00042197 [Cyprinus carpio]|nr:hypothetical protein cypCar_00042197 [Cyprinus carpio]